jgi:hypothetical protein
MLVSSKFSTKLILPFAFYMFCHKHTGVKQIEKYNKKQRTDRDNNNSAKQATSNVVGFLFCLVNNYYIILKNFFFFIETENILK